jgi:hypothetical protein
MFLLHMSNSWKNEVTKTAHVRKIKKNGDEQFQIFILEKNVAVINVFRPIVKYKNTMEYRNSYLNLVLINGDYFYERTDNLHINGQ